MSKKVASSNWLALQKKLAVTAKKSGSSPQTALPRKRRKLDHNRSTEVQNAASSSRTSHSTTFLPETTLVASTSDTNTKNGESIPALRKMVLGQIDCSEQQCLPGKYLALDCEMVGVGIDGAESSLARVSLVNYYGAIQLDKFVRQRERVVDYRTQYSGVRESDMVKAEPFEEIQKEVAGLLKDRILVGHAVFNDLKALLLSHPWSQTRDTQYYSGKFKVTPSKYGALRNIVKQELGLTIQSGEHSSVTDARATMAVFRIHRKEWEKGSNITGVSKLAKQKGKRRLSSTEDDNSEDEEDPPRTKFPGGGRKGVSSGLSTIVKKGGVRSGNPGSGEKEKSQWWKELGTGQAKGSIRLKT